MPPTRTKDAFFASLRPTPSGCLEWTGSKDIGGYGRTSYRGNPTNTHRLAYRLAYGDIPAGLLVCHSCDNRACCNPEHLFLGSHSDNTRDCVNKGRWVQGGHPNTGFSKYPLKGTDNVKAKLTEAKVKRIRALYATGTISQTRLAAKYGMHQTTISAIVRGVYWPDVS